MVSANGLAMGNQRTRHYLLTHPKEAPLSVQLFGSDPEIMARAAETAQETGANVIDINMGCPVKKVVKTGAGAALLKDLPAISRLLKEVRKAITCPLTVKIRSGWTAGKIVAPDVALLAQDMGADAVTVHPRTARQGFSGSADWGLIREIKKRVSIPVIGNGDVKEPSQVPEMMKYTACDGIMIGRGCLGNPWIFSQVLDLALDREPCLPTLEQREAVIMRHFALLKEYAPVHRVVSKMRGQVMTYVKGLPMCSAFRRVMHKVRTEERFFEILSRYFSFLKHRQRVYES